MLETVVTEYRLKGSYYTRVNIVVNPWVEQLMLMLDPSIDRNNILTDNRSVSQVLSTITFNHNYNVYILLPMLWLSFILMVD